jgi:hypothetical protein
MSLFFVPGIAACEPGFYKGVAGDGQVYGN